MIERIRKQDMSQWGITTRHFGSLETAMADAQLFVHRASHLIIWPLNANDWLLIIGISALVN